MEEYHTLSKATHKIYHYANRTMGYAQIHYFHYFQNNLSQSTISQYNALGYPSIQTYINLSRSEQAFCFILMLAMFYLV